MSAAPELEITGPAEGWSDDWRDEMHDGEPSADARSPSPWESHIKPAPAEWFETAPPARTWLLRDGRRSKADGLLPLGKVGQLIAEGGAGKTMVATQLAISVSTGVAWLGTFNVASPGRVLLVVGEEDEEEAQRRLYRARLAMRAPVPHEDTIVALPLAGVPCAMLAKDTLGNLCETAFLEWLRTWLTRRGPWSLVIVDPLSRFAGPDAEIDNAAATRFIQALESLASLTGATVLVAHHTNKLSRRGGAVEGVAGRGSSALFDGARWQASLGVERLALEDPEARDRLGELVTWAHTKSNYSRRADQLLLRRDLDHGGALVPLDGADLAAVEAARARDPGREQKQQAKDDAETVRRLAEDAAVVQAVTERPGIVTRDLATRVQAIAGCRRDRALVAVARVSPTLDVQAGPRGAKLHFVRSRP